MDYKKAIQTPENYTLDIEAIVPNLYKYILHKIPKLNPIIFLNFPSQTDYRELMHIKENMPPAREEVSTNSLLQDKGKELGAIQLAYWNFFPDISLSTYLLPIFAVPFGSTIYRIHTHHTRTLGQLYIVYIVGSSASFHVDKFN